MTQDMDKYDVSYIFRKGKHEYYNVNITLLEHFRCLLPEENSSNYEIICH
jgi:hypothetical protein